MPNIGSLDPGTRREGSSLTSLMYSWQIQCFFFPSQEVHFVDPVDDSEIRPLHQLGWGVS